MPDIRAGREAVVRRILEGTGEASASERRAAFDNSGLSGPAGALVDKVARSAWKVSDEDIDAACAWGMSEDQIFEIVVCAAVGQANRQCETALAALETACRKE
ncbi:MAG: hypothetical protein WA399_00940 [Acidobacteriaceae bacterium]